MNKSEIIKWLLEDDVSIQYQTQRDLLGQSRVDLQDRIAQEGWGARFLSLRNKNGYWGRGFYQPKWTSTHYTLLDLRNLNISPGQTLIRESVQMIAKNEKGEDGGINPSGTIRQSDVCINGMFLNYACYFGIEEELLISVIDYLLLQKLEDGGFNCVFNRSGARHSSLHSTLSVLEGCIEYIRNGYTYRSEEISRIIQECREFILLHQLYISDRTGKVIRKDFLKLSYPGRWYFDILRALDCFRHAGFPWDDRMQPAVDTLLKKRTPDGVWKLQAHHPGAFHFQMEPVGQPGRWNTLRALRVLNYYGKENLLD